MLSHEVLKYHQKFQISMVLFLFPVLQSVTSGCMYLLFLVNGNVAKSVHSSPSYAPKCT